MLKIPTSPAAIRTPLRLPWSCARRTTSLRFSSASASTPPNTEASNSGSNNSHEIPFYGSPRPPSSSDSSSSLTRRLALALQSAATAFRDPTRDDAVASLGELTGSLALHRIRQDMRSHPTGQQILHDRPLVTRATIPYQDLLQQAQNIPFPPPNDVTFGQAYGSFLHAHGFDPDERKPVQHIPHDEELAYVMTRYRQCHDYWHALTGLPPTVLGELGLKWLELFQTGLPIAALSCTVGTFGLDYPQQQILWNVYLPWATKIHRAQQQQQQQQHSGGGSSCSLVTVYYEQEFDTPLQELRQRLCIEPAPDVGEEYKY